VVALRLPHPLGGKGVMLAGTLPDSIQFVLAYQAGMLKRTTSAEGAGKLLAFLATTPARKHSSTAA
jgi:hypothetical protein